MATINAPTINAPTMKPGAVSAPPTIDHNAAMASFKAEDNGTALPTSPINKPQGPRKGEPIDANALRKKAGEPEITIKDGRTQKPEPEKKSDKKPHVEPNEDKSGEDVPEKEDPKKEDDLSLSFQDDDEPEVEEETEETKKLDKKRDYSKFHKDLHPILGKLPNHLFEQYAPVLEQWREAYEQQGKTPPYLGLHKEGYILNPEYRTAVEETNLAGVVISHWENQLQNIVEGKAWKNLAGVDEKTGRFIYEEQPAAKEGTIDQKAKMLVERELARLDLQRSKLQDKVSTMRAEHEKLHLNEKKQVDELVKKFFGTKALSPEEVELAEKFRKATLPYTSTSNPLWAFMAPLLVNYVRIKNKAEKLFKESGPQKPKVAAAAPKPGAGKSEQKKGLDGKKWSSPEEFHKYLEEA